jgi:hypothetical protein
MTRTALLILGLALGSQAALWAQAPMNLDLLIDRRGVYLHPQTLDAYTGPVIAMWDAVHVRERGTLRNGRWDGVREAYYSDGKLELRETYANGVLHGPFESYFRSGRPSDKGTYRNGLLEGDYEAYWSRTQSDLANSHAADPRKSSDPVRAAGDLMETGRWSAGTPCGEWYRYLPTSYMGNRAGFTVRYPSCPADRG